MAPQKRIYRRLEANPFLWKALTERQKSAIEIVAQLLLDAIKDIEHSAATTTKDLEFNRRMQLAFVDGDRGMGKTSVLLSVRNLIENKEIDSDGLPAVVRELRGDRKKFVWLETLDMEPLAQSANLLAAILVRISALIESAMWPTPRLALALDDIDGREKLESELQTLAHDAVLAWEGTERQRLSHVDPTAYVADVLASERAGIRLNPRLRQVLDGIARTYFADCGAGPVFVMPIDDFDLAPTRCLELLRIMRMVTTPRLFFLVAGNTRLAESVLRLQGEGELALLAPSLMNGREGEWVRGAAMQLAANNLRKLIPPQNRALLERVSVSEARNFRPRKHTPSMRSSKPSHSNAIIRRLSVAISRSSHSFFWIKRLPTLRSPGWRAPRAR